MKLLLFIILFSLPLVADDLTLDPPLPWNTECTLPTCCFPNNITLDLNAPLYEAGLFSTEEGGILRAENLFVQARKIRYYEQEGEKTLYCSEDLLVEFHGQVIVGQEFFFDLCSNSGYVTCARTAFDPWQLGASTIYLCPDGSLDFEEGYLTTSEGEEHQLSLVAHTLRIDCERRLITSALQVRLYDRPLMLLPGVKLDLSRLKRPPLDVKFGWGGYLGPHISLRYHALSYQDFKASLRVDGYLTHGLGLGIETSLDPPCLPLAFYTRNYWAHDLAIDDPTKRNRYRFQGSYYNQFFQERTTLRARYDYVSDAQMAADYNHESFLLNPAQDTKLLLHHRENHFLANLCLNVRLNSFQSVDQQLPRLEWHFHPVLLPYTPCIFENRITLSHINFVTSNALIDPLQQQSLRLDIRPTLYMPLQTPYFSLVPRAGLIAIGYSNSPQKQSQNQILAHLSAEATTTFSRPLPCGAHLILPHARLTHLTTPTSNLEQHFIFTLEDGYTRFSELRFGIKNLLFFSSLCHPLSLDLWANYFIDPQNKIQPLPKSYLDIDWQLTPTLFLYTGVGIHHGKDRLDYLNSRCEWSLSERAAFNVEYRYRGSYAWRKADFFNFILDTARNEESLLASTLSDKRHTFLTTLFYRINPDWNLHLTTRYGWHAKQARSYFEYELASRAMILDHWWLLFSYQHRESDSRFAFSLKLVR